MTRSNTLFFVAACSLLMWGLNASSAFGEIANSDQPVAEDSRWRVGMAKVDITPTEPLRLSGYAGRVDSHTAVADPLHVRAVVLAPENDDLPQRLQKPLVLISIESIAVTSRMTTRIAEFAREQFEVPRSHVIVSSSHSHTAPHLPDSIDNLFQSPSTDQQNEAAQRYLDQIFSAVEQAMEQAFQSRVAGARVSIGQSIAQFGVQRRVIRDGSWKGFGIQEGGQTDHRVHLLKITGEDGRLLGAVYQYACHCTSLIPEFNQISGDWAGLSASRLEELYPGTVFLPVIGCGGDINPEPRGGYDAAVQSAMQMVDSVRVAVQSDEFTSLPHATSVQFGFAGLEPEQPTQQRIKDLLESNDPNERRWAQRMQQTRLAKGRLPESYPMPIHVWTFGDRLSWVFLGGEVVTDYQYSIEKELPTSSTWVAAYCDDVFGYVASESMRSEGGYEVDYSMIYYLQPGRWKSGTQSNILTRVREISRQERGEDEPLDPDAAHQSMKVPEGYRVDLVASEPQIQDPVNIAFGWDGSVWVVEMSDYPTGSQGGSVKVLRDTTGDGILDHSATFLEGLSYPTSVQPWRRGALIIAAPNIIYAEDTNGDSIADQQQILISGIGEVNPQHRGSGFELGLDGRLHFAAGEGTKELVSHLTGQTLSVQGNDVVWNPDTGEIEVFVYGKTQFVPARDAFDNWFGNHNILPMFQFVFGARQLGSRSVDSGSVHHLLNPPEAPPVFPRSRTVDRFNDLHTADRYTSACGSMIVKVPGMFPKGKAADSSYPVALICEPVHNLVARVQLHPDGAVFSGRRHPDDEQFDFFASTDPWSRPVRAVNAPDGSIWILDMYRQVIEHPQWIPTAWLERLDVRAGEGLGRIYRVYHSDHAPRALVDYSSHDPIELLQSPNGAVRDMATQAIVTGQIEFDDPGQLLLRIRELLDQPQPAEVVASLLGVLASQGGLEQDDLLSVMKKYDNPQLLGWVVKLAARFESLEPSLRSALESLPQRDLGASLDLQWILASLNWSDFSAEAGLAAILSRGQPDRWLSAALTLMDSPTAAGPIVEMMLQSADRKSLSAEQLQNQVGTLRRLVSQIPVSQRQQLFAQHFGDSESVEWSPGLSLLLTVLASECPQDLDEDALKRVLTQATDALLSSQQQYDVRDWLSLLLGNQLLSPEQELKIAGDLLAQDTGAVSLAVQRSRLIAHDDLAGQLLSQWNRLSYQDQATVASTLLSRPAWREQLIQSLENQHIRSNQLPPAVVQTLVGHYDRNLRSRAVAVFGRPSPRQNVVNDYLTRMPNPATSGDSLRGEIVYREHCAVCHERPADRMAIGPALDNLGSWNNEQWIAAVFDPSLAVEEKYKQTVILTVDQEVLSGIVVEETGSLLKLAGNDGVIQEVLISDIEDRKRSNVSLMPDGFEAKITPEQMADLIRYLRTK